MTRTWKRLSLVLGVVVVAVALGAGPAAAAPAQIQDDVWLPSNADYGSGTHCLTRNIDLAAGNYLWEGHETLLDRTTGGDYTTIDRDQRIIYLRASSYRWSTCLVYHPNSCTGPGGNCSSNAWIQHSNSLTDRETGGVARLSGYVRDQHYEYVTRYGANLWQCSTESVC